MRILFKSLYNKLFCIILLTGSIFQTNLFAEKNQIKLDGSYLVGCSFLEKSLGGLSVFRTKEFEFTKTCLIVTDFKTKNYTEYSYQIDRNIIHLTKKSGLVDYFDENQMEFEISSKDPLSERELIFYKKNGKKLKFLEEKSFRKTTSDIGITTALAGVTVGASGLVLSSYLNQFKFPNPNDYRNMNLNQIFKLYVGESNGRRLSDNLEKAGIPKPLKESAAHHIVPKKDTRGNSAVSRKILEEVGIDLDNPLNGVYLPTDKTFSKITGIAFHAPNEYMHGTDFLEGLTQRLLQARGDRLAVEEVLYLARDNLLNGKTW